MFTIAGGIVLGISFLAVIAGLILLFNEHPEWFGKLLLWISGGVCYCVISLGLIILWGLDGFLLSVSLPFIWMFYRWASR